VPEALQLLELAITLAPDAPGAHNNYGIALAQAGRLDEAVTHWQEALRVDPGDVNARRNLEMLRPVPR
jgi:protein O-mannosyl-transferase